MFADNSVLFSSSSLTSYIVQKSTGYLIANSAGAPIYDTSLNMFIKANTSINTVIANSYKYLIDHGLYEDCTVDGLYVDGRTMTISLAHMKDASGTNEFQVVYVKLVPWVTRESLLADDIATDLDFNINNRASATAWLMASFSGNVSTTPMSTTLLHTTIAMNGDTMQAFYGLKARYSLTP